MLAKRVGIAESVFQGLPAKLGIATRADSQNATNITNKLQGYYSFIYLCTYMKPTRIALSVENSTTLGFSGLRNNFLRFIKEGEDSLPK